MLLIMATVAIAGCTAEKVNKAVDNRKFYHCFILRRKMPQK